MKQTVKSIIDSNYMREIVIALRQDTIYAMALIPTKGPTPDTWNRSIAVEPVMITDPTVDNIANALQKTLAIALSYPEPLPVIDRNFATPWLKSAGLKSDRQFAKGQSVCFLYVFPDRVNIRHSKPQKSGYGFDGDGDTTLPSDCTFEDVAKVVLESLQDPSHMHPL